MAEPSDHLYASGLPESLTDAQLKEAFGAYGTVKWARMSKKPNGVTALVQFSTVEECSFLVENLSGSSLHELLPDPVQLQFHKSNWVPGGKGAGGGGGAGGGWGKAKGKGGFGGDGDEEGENGKGKGKGWGGPYGAFGAWGGGKGFGMMPMMEATIGNLKKGLMQGGVLPGGKWTDDDPALYISGLPADTNDTDLYEIFAPFGAIPPKGIRAMRNKEDDSKCTGVGFVNFVQREDAEKAIMALNGTMLPDGTALRVQIKGKKKPREPQGPPGQ